MAETEKQWFDTNNKPYYLEYDLPLSIRNRCWFFWANSVKEWRKVLNRANELANGNKISVVFFFGEIDTTVTNYIKKLNNSQMVILHACYAPVDYLKAIDSEDEWLMSVQKWGGRAQDENKQWVWDVSEIFLDHAKAFEASRYDYMWFSLAKAYVGEIRESVERNGYQVLGNFLRKHVSGNQTEIVADLLAIIKELFPCGIEADTNEEFAYKTLAVPKLIKLGIDGKTDEDDKLIKNCGVHLPKEKGIIQLSLFDDFSESAMQIVALIRETYRQDIKRLGYCNATALRDALTNRPYGVYDCNYYYYVVAYALSEFRAGYYTDMSFLTKRSHYDDCLEWFRIEEIEYNRNTIFLPTLFVQTEKQHTLAQKLCRVFDITDDVNTVFKAVQKARGWVMEHIHYDSIDRVSHKLFEFLRGDNIRMYSLETERLADWLDEPTIAELHDKIATIDEVFFKRLIDKYGKEKAELYKRHLNVNGTAGGWLWRSEMIDESVEVYMSKILCRECGRVLNPMNDDHCWQVSSYGGKGESHYFSLKQIQGLNKKFFGRFQTDYFCIPCMAEILGMTEMELWERMCEFKEGGCTLF